MTFTLKPNRENRYWIKKNREKNALDAKTTALNRWTTEGGLVADEKKADTRKRPLVYRKHKRDTTA
jgi:hypothetical protein